MTQSHQSCPHTREAVASLMAALEQSSSGFDWHSPRTFKAAVALHYAYYNSVKSNIAIRCTPAMAAGVANSLWTVRDLVEMVEA